MVPFWRLASPGIQLSSLILLSLAYGCGNCATFSTSDILNLVDLPIPKAVRIQKLDSNNYTIDLDIFTSPINGDINHYSVRYDITGYLGKEELACTKWSKLTNISISPIGNSIITFSRSKEKETIEFWTRNKDHSFVKKSDLSPPRGNITRDCQSFWSDKSDQFALITELGNVNNSDYWTYLQKSWSNLREEKFFVYSLSNLSAEISGDTMRDSTKSFVFLPDGVFLYVGIAKRHINTGVTDNKPSRLYAQYKTATLKKSTSATVIEIVRLEDTILRKYYQSDQFAIRSICYSEDKVWMLVGSVGGSHNNTTVLASLPYKGKGKFEMERLEIHLKDLSASLIEAKGNLLYFQDQQRSLLTFRVFDTSMTKELEIFKQRGNMSLHLYDIDEVQKLGVFTMSSPCTPVSLNLLIWDERLLPKIPIGLANYDFQLHPRFKAVPLKMSGGFNLPRLIPFINECTFKIEPLGEFSEYFIVLPGNGKNKKDEAIVYLHGGPNRCYPTIWNRDVSALILRGYTVIVVNYTGSMGFGQAGIDALKGKIGEIDAADVRAAIEGSNKKYGPFKKIHGYGVSYGGYLAAMITANYPNLLSTALLVGPVVDLSSICLHSEFPDWAFGQLGLHYSNQHLITNSLFEEFRKFSPLTYVNRVRTPTLVVIGGQDLRVPPSQGRTWVRLLQENQVSAHLLECSNDGHRLSPRCRDIMYHAAFDFMEEKFPTIRN